MNEPPTQAELEAAHCWDANDRVPGRPTTTGFRRTVRLHHARWREANGHPIGTQPIVPRPDGPPARPVGSRLPLPYAIRTGANLLTTEARAAARARTSMVERHQSFDHQRLWADLLSSAALSFNLFADLASDPARADRAVHEWWPDAPGNVVDVRFAHSPGRRDPAYINNLSAFDVTFVLEAGNGTRALVAVDTKYHERIKREIPKPRNLRRYLEVSTRSGAFHHGGLAAVNATELTEMWLEHVLLLSMLQNELDGWSWGRYVVVHPEGNPDLTSACGRYRDLLVDDSTFSSVSLEALLAAGALPHATTAALRGRYLLA